MRGPLFVSFEGMDGSGKSTQVALLAEHLHAQGREVRVLREPGGTELGEHVRDLLLAGGEVVPWAEVSLFAAARAQLVATVLRPALEAGCDVICDRYVDSSVAYQGIARSLGPELVLDWNLRVTGGLLPELTFLLSVPVEAASTRIAQASAGRAPARAQPDRLERESISFRERVASAYDELARRSTGRIVKLDGTRSAETIADEIARRVDRLIDPRGAAPE
jgi:dTMP kinase